ncbi:hypothetical protein [Paracoccus spongiarum]|uniref:Uncharacterized protein n=1 Tax=Paracoccus spongiarum TaxID=3064387 RepID=A0ABT9JC91_9RHOB|nr:hypothetical protein [Paracoccus sp. 2205BS29-5]MDP5306736.1 hypothetical protein [Paracoccus sp. 2205BS29-5]
MSGRDAGGGIFTGDFRERPYWWGDSPPDATPPDDLPGRADAMVTGSSQGGLHAPLHLSRAGRVVVVQEAGLPGQG